VLPPPALYDCANAKGAEIETTNKISQNVTPDNLIILGPPSIKSANYFSA